MSEIKQNIIELFSRLWVWVAYIFFGLVGKLSYDLMRGKKLTWAQFFGSFGIAIFVGFIAASICHNVWEPDKALKYGSVIVSISSCIAKDVMNYLFTRDWNKAFDNAVIWLKNKK